MTPSPRSTRWSQRRMKKITRAFQSALEDSVIRGLWGCLALFAAEAWQVPVEPLPGDMAAVQVARDALGDAANDKRAVVEALVRALLDRGPKDLATVVDRLWPFIVAITESWFTGRTLLAPLSTERLSADNPLRRDPDGSLAHPEDWAQIPSKRRMQWLMEYDAFTTLSSARAPGRRRTSATAPSTGAVIDCPRTWRSASMNCARRGVNGGTSSPNRSIPTRTASFGGAMRPASVLSVCGIAEKASCYSAPKNFWTLPINVYLPSHVRFIVHRIFEGHEPGPTA
jgi:hypothetical protein